MSYQVLARKWRPQVFEDVVGQGHITRTLQNAITTKRLAHAFLFSGPRGVGKTTTARILAKALNCTQGPTPTPCGRCDSCIETTAGTSVDVIEIDGASNRGIEHIRELREAVKYAPARGKYKVYVIDEVHMLTNEAFNALLKTLEEPPPHVLFIFATTEPQKIPATIHSRCQRYGFKRIPLNDIVEQLHKIAAAEGITITDQGLAMIARAAEGSMRDSQSLLDQAVSYSGMTVKNEDLQATLGSVAQEKLLQFSAGLLSRDSGGLLKQIDGLLEQGLDMRQFLAGLVEHVRNIMVIKIATDPGRIIELPAADIQNLQQQAAGVDSDHLLLLFDSLSKTLDEMRWSPHQRFTVEMGIVKACHITPLRPLTEVLARMKELESRLTPGMLVAAPAPGAVCEQPGPYVPKTAAVSHGHRPAEARGGAGEGASDAWGRVMSALKMKKPGLYSSLGSSKMISLTENELVISVHGMAFQVQKVEEQESRSTIEEVAEEILGRKVRVKVQAAATPLPAKPDTKARTVKSSNPEEQDPAIQDVLKAFPGAEIIESDNPEA
jgi:DNA polymerase III subunit gamma/tau